ncbi:MAG: PQQ-binding-like beta-propeller repeat protein, partial [Planctomycetota bacterium]
MRLAILAALLSLGGAARAADPDGAVAEAGRWCHVSGPASGSGRSRDEAPESLGPILWSHKTPEPILAPPVVWDGVGFLLHGGAKQSTLVAFDVETGVLAKTTLKAPVLPEPAAYRRSVFLVEEGRRVVQYRLRGRQLARGWSFEIPKSMSAPRVHSGEIYVT